MTIYRKYLKGLYGNNIGEQTYEISLSIEMVSDISNLQRQSSGGVL